MDNVNVIRTGFMAPDFSLPNSHGNMFKLQDNLKGCFVAVCFFPSLNNPDTHKLLMEINKGLPNTSSGIPIKTVAILPEKVQTLEKLKYDSNIKMTLLSDIHLEVSRRYYVVDSNATKPGSHFAVFIVDDEAIVRHRIVGIDEYSQVDIEQLKQEIVGLI